MIMSPRETPQLMNPSTLFVQAKTGRAALVALGPLLCAMAWASLPHSSLTRHALYTVSPLPTFLILAAASFHRRKDLLGLFAICSMLAVAANAAAGLAPSCHRDLQLDFFRGTMRRPEAETVWDHHWGHYAHDATGSFRMHLATGILVFLLGPLQFSSWLRCQAPRVHKSVGYSYTGASVGCTGSALRLAWRTSLGWHVQVAIGTYK
jgi:hypothetical protein